MSEQTLSPTTVVNYRSRLRTLKLVVDKLEGEAQIRAVNEIAKLERQLGPMVESPRRPGRPKVRADVPKELLPEAATQLLIADNPWAEEAVAKRKALNIVKLRERLFKLEQEEAQRKDQAFNADDAWTKIDQEMERIRKHEKEVEKGAERPDQGSGRTGETSERGVSREAKGES